MATAFFDDALRRISALPGVESASAVRILPSDGNGASVPFEIDGRPAPVPTETPQACQQVVTPGYFDTLRIPIVSGRGFTEADREDTLPVAMLSQGAQRRFWLEEDPVLAPPQLLETDKAADLRWCGLDALPDPVVPHELFVLERLRDGGLPPVVALGF